MIKKITVVLLVCMFNVLAIQAQNLTATFETEDNTQCEKPACEHTGPNILINEIMISPAANDGCLSGQYSLSCRGEWIELYNPNPCDSIDLSCYYLGGVSLSPLQGQGINIPNGSVVPPNGFAIIRGVNAPQVQPHLLVENGGNVVDIVLPDDINTDGNCVDGTTSTRLWFPNVGGWVALYDINGVVLDAISWGNEADIHKEPCVPIHSSCSTNNITSLDSYSNIPPDKKVNIYSLTLAATGNSVRRIPDGGSWAINQEGNPTMGKCNDVCAHISNNHCDGQATINVAGGSGNYYYKWDDDLGQTTATATGLCEGSYTVEVIDSWTGVVRYFTVEINNVEVDVHFVINEELCDLGQVVSLSDIADFSPLPTLGQTSSFSGQGIDGETLDISDIGAGTSLITYEVIDENGCSGSAEATVIIHELPQAQISGIASEYCLSNEVVEPTFSPLDGVLSGPGVVNNQFSINEAGVGTHTLNYFVENDFGCSSSVDVTVNIVEGIEAQISGIASEYCLSNEVVEPTFSPLGGVLSGPGVFNNKIIIEAAGVGTHIINYTVENEEGCQSFASITMTVHESVDFAVTVNPTDCNQENGEITLTPTSGSFPFYYSIDGGVNLQNDSIFINLSEGTYPVVVIDSNGCERIKNAIIETKNAPDPSFAFNDYCEGNIGQPTDIATPGGTFSFVPQPNDGATIDSLTGIISNGVGGTTYAVEYLTPGSCPSFSVVELTVIEQPSVGISANPTQGNSPLTVDFTNHSIGGDNYTWYFEEGSSLSNNNDFLTYTFYEEGTYVVFLIGEAGDGMCTDTSTIEIIVQAEEMVYEFPNVFTPNNDFINDNFQFVHHKNIESLEIIILNRWGNLVFESNEINFKWDGTVLDSGTECVDGTYFYKANIKNSAGKVVQEHGYVRLVRE